MSKQLTDTIIMTEMAAQDIYKIRLKSGYISANAIPGQFVNIKCCEGAQALLRRPFCICSADGKNGSYDIMFQKKGTGTNLLTQKKPGDTLDVLGPLGNGFDMDPGYKRIAVIGGGIGVFPLLFLLSESKADVKRVYLGFRTARSVVLEDEFRRESTSLEIATDDGSYGTGGFITDLFERDLLSGHFGRFDMVYACGPVPMLKKAAEAANATGTNCQLSLEQRMGCGFGTCLVCACKTRSDDGGWQYSRVCSDGPVFDSKVIIFD